MKQVGVEPIADLRVSQPGDNYLHRALDAFGMRRGGRQGHFLAGSVRMSQPVAGRLLA